MDPLLYSLWSDRCSSQVAILYKHFFYVTTSHRSRKCIYSIKELISYRSCNEDAEVFFDWVYVLNVLVKMIRKPDDLFTFASTLLVRAAGPGDPVLCFLAAERVIRLWSMPTIFRWLVSWPSVCAFIPSWSIRCWTSFGLQENKEWFMLTCPILFTFLPFHAFGSSWLANVCDWQAALVLSAILPCQQNDPV